MQNNNNDEASPLEYELGSQTTSTPEEVDDSITGRDFPRVEEELYGYGKPKRITIRAKIIRDKE